MCFFNCWATLRHQLTNNACCSPTFRYKTALDEVNARPDILPHFKLSLAHESAGCNGAVAVQGMMKHLDRIRNYTWADGKTAVGFIGPACSGATKAVYPILGHTRMVTPSRFSCSTRRTSGTTRSRLVRTTAEREKRPRLVVPEHSRPQASISRKALDLHMYRTRYRKTTSTRSR